MPGEGDCLRRRSALIALLATLPAVAAASAYDVEARTEAALDTLRLRGDEVALRRRLVQVLDLAGFELVAGEDAGIALALRFDADFGVTAAEAAGLDGVRRDRLQLLDARFHWRGLAGGRLDLELGRITALGPVTFQGFDGGRVTLRPVHGVSLTVFGGLRETPSSWLAVTQFTPDGVRESDLRRIRAGLATIPCPEVPNRLCADPTLTEAAPTFGGRLALGDLPGAGGTGADVEYRRTLRAGGVIEERAGGTALYRRGPVELQVRGEYDLYVERFTAIRGAARVAVLPWLSLSAEASRWHESFSADSIWNLYDTAPWDEGTLRADLAPLDAAWRGYLTAGAQRFTPTELGKLFGDTGGLGPVAGAGIAASFASWRIASDASYRSGVEGRQAFLGASAARPLARWLTADARLTIARMDDAVLASRSGNFASAALLLAGRLERRARISLLVEEATSPWRRADLRLFAFLVVGTDWDTRSPAP